MTEAAAVAAPPTRDATRPPRVLHVVGMLDRWSVEAWLLRLLAHAQRRGVALDWSFYSAFGLPGSRDAEAEALGATVTRSPVPVGAKLPFAAALRAEARRGGYDVLHFHHDLISGVYLTATAGLPGARIVHVHNLDESVLTPDPVKQKMLRPMLRSICLRTADRIVANSDPALETFLAGRRRQPSRHRVIPIGVDPAPFALPQDRAMLRRDLGVPADAPVLLFAGRMTPEKNPVFAVDVLAALRRRLPDAVAVFAGDGDLSDAVAARATDLGVADAVRLVGWRGDVGAVMGAGDWFILPHPHDPAEAFGVAVVEAQLAGLRLLLSLGVSEAPLLPGASWRRLPLDAGADAWADAAIALWRAPAPSRETALAALAASPMDLDRNLAALCGLHAEAAAAR